VEEMHSQETLWYCWKQSDPEPSFAPLSVGNASHAFVDIVRLPDPSSMV